MLIETSFQVEKVETHYFAGQLYYISNFISFSNFQVAIKTKN